MDQAMLGMPSREYYLTETDSEHKEAYLRYMINVAKLFKADETVAVRDMNEVLRFEELLANVYNVVLPNNYRTLYVIYCISVIRLDFMYQFFILATFVA